MTHTAGPPVGDSRPRRRDVRRARRGFGSAAVATVLAAVAALRDAGRHQFSRRSEDEITPPRWQRRAGTVTAAIACLAVGVAGLSPAVPDSMRVLTLYGESVDLSEVLEAQEVAGVTTAAGFSRSVQRTFVVRKRSVDTFDAAVEYAASSCVAYPLTSYRLTSPYGERVHPIFGGLSMHYGTDFAAPLGTPIHAVADGTVVYSGPGRLGRSDELVIIEHDVAGEHFFSWYVHMYRDGIFVDIGDVVLAGDVIAEVGNNGNSTGPHLHLEIHTSDPGVGLRKTPTVSNASAVVTTFPFAAPSPSGSVQPSDEPAPEPSPTQEPTTSPSPDPTDGEPSEEPSSPGPTDEPTTEEPSSPGPTDEPTTEEPTTEEPSTEEPTDEPTEEPTSEEVEDFEPRERVPFPVRASGTTVDPIPFLQSLGLSLLPPLQCAAER